MLCNFGINSTRNWTNRHLCQLLVLLMSNCTHSHAINYTYKLLHLPSSIDEVQDRPFITAMSTCHTIGNHGDGLHPKVTGSYSTSTIGRVGPANDSMPGCQGCLDTHTQEQSTQKGKDMHQSVKDVHQSVQRSQQIMVPYRM